MSERDSVCVVIAEIRALKAEDVSSRWQDEFKTAGTLLRTRQEPEMNNEIELISDGNGIAIYGSSANVDLFLVAEGLATKTLDVPHLSSVLRGGSIASEVASGIAANSGRWVKMTEESANLIKKYDLMKGSTSDLSRGVIQAKNGQIQGLVEFV